MNATSHQIEHRFHRPAFVLLAFVAMWLQVMFTGIHLSSEAMGALGASEGTSPIWMICTANGLRALGDNEHSTGSGANLDCSICSSGVADGWAFEFSFPKALNAIHQFDITNWLIYDQDTSQSSPPRAGASRAPPITRLTPSISLTV